MKLLILVIMILSLAIIVYAESRVMPFNIGGFFGGTVCNNDGSCDTNENETNCPNDCKPTITNEDTNVVGNQQINSNYDLQEENLNDNVKITKIERPKKIPGNKLAYASVFVFIFVIILFFLVLWLNKHGLFQEKMRSEGNKIKKEKQIVNNFGLPMKPSRSLSKKR